MLGGAFVWLVALGTAAAHATQGATLQRSTLAPALPPDATGQQIFEAACATCHAPDGTGSAQRIVGFSLPLPNGHDLPDFTDCPSNTVEPSSDWFAVISRGGRVRGLDRHMPAFGDALAPAQIDAAIRYARSFCADRAWPPGDLNLPRSFFTEKAFPENELIVTTGIVHRGTGAVTTQFLYEHRLGARGHYEIAVPVNAQQKSASGGWHEGLGDIELAMRHTLYADAGRGTIVAAGAGVTLPTGDADKGLGNGFAVYEPFAMAGQVIGANGSLQVHVGLEIPSDRQRGQTEGFVRTALGYTFAQEHGLGRTWTPMFEVLMAKPSGGATEWDVVPELQISLSKLQHVLLSVGVRVPVTQRQSRSPQVLTYFLWDWFDGGLFQFWK